MSSFITRGSPFSSPVSKAPPRRPEAASSGETAADDDNLVQAQASLSKKLDAAMQRFYIDEDVVTDGT